MIIPYEFERLHREKPHTFPFAHDPTRLIVIRSGAENRVPFRVTYFANYVFTQSEDEPNIFAVLKNRSGVLEGAADALAFALNLPIQFKLCKNVIIATGEDALLLRLKGL